MIKELSEKQQSCLNALKESKSFNNQKEAEKFGKLPIGKCSVIDITTVEMDNGNEIPCFVIQNDKKEKGNLFLGQFLAITIDNAKDCLVEGKKGNAEGNFFIIPRKRNKLVTTTDFENLHTVKTFMVEMDTDGSKLPFTPNFNGFKDAETALEYFNSEKLVQTMYKVTL